MTYDGAGFASNTPDAQANRRSEDLDEKDLKLISLLRRNARAPIVSLARHIGLSHSATQDRLARLEGSGAITGYTVVEGAPGTIVQAAHLLARFESGKTCDQIAPRGESDPVRHADRFPGWRNRSARQRRCRFNRQCRGRAPPGRFRSRHRDRYHRSGPASPSVSRTRVDAMSGEPGEGELNG
ncbi:Lrp/AsnC family transcriptional regulator [Sinorhizobium meliloti]